MNVRSASSPAVYQGTPVAFYVEVEITSVGCVVQEVTTSDGKIVVEAWRDGGSSWDEHAWTDGGVSPTHTRSMLVYDAVVEGADWTPDGFAILPANRDGSVVTNLVLGGGMNEHYLQAHSVTGYVLSDDRPDGIAWVIDWAAPDDLTVTVSDSRATR